MQYARQIKFLLAETFGLRSKSDSDEDYYFGGSYFAAQIIPPPRLIESLFRGKHEIRFLLNDDNYFISMRNMWADFRNNIASRTNFDLRKLPQLHERLIENSKLKESEYDIVAINAPWLGEAVKKNLVIPLDCYIKPATLSPLDFHPSVWSMGSWRGEQFGVPIYCTIELLAVRKDLFEKDRIDYPTTFERTVAAAKHFHEPAKERYGIAWNGGRGMPIASTFMFLMGCCGESILRIPKTNLTMGVDEAQGEQLRPQIQSEAGLRVLDYLHKLKEVSPPDILEMDWDRRTTSFLSGQTALAYCWTVRAARFENDISSAVKRKVSYLPQPRGPGGVSNNPIGGFLLCIPSNLPEDRIERAFEAIAWMTSPEAMKANVQNGFPVAPRFSVSADPEAAATSPIVSVVDRLAKRNLLKGVASAAGARISVARGDPWRRDPPGPAGRGLGPGGAKQCAGGGRQGHARSRVLLASPLRSERRFRATRKVGHVHFGHIPARPVAGPVVTLRHAPVGQSDPFQVRGADKKI